jgi:hypothetical protein
MAEGWLAEPRLAPFRNSLGADDPLVPLWQRVRALAGAKEPSHLTFNSSMRNTSVAFGPILGGLPAWP